MINECVAECFPLGGGGSLLGGRASVAFECRALGAICSLLCVRFGGQLFGMCQRRQCPSKFRMQI